MDIEKLIGRLQNNRHPNGLKSQAAIALSTLQAENEKLRDENNMLRRMQPVELNGESARSLSLALEASQLRAELEQVKRERNAAVEDVAAIIGDVEEIRRGYDVGNADADGAFAVLCETYCTNKGRSCYAECEKYHCKNFKWRGLEKED